MQVQALMETRDIVLKENTKVLTENIDMRRNMKKLIDICSQLKKTADESKTKLDDSKTKLDESKSKLSVTEEQLRLLQCKACQKHIANIIVRPCGHIFCTNCAPTAPPTQLPSPSSSSSSSSSSSLTAPSKKRKREDDCIDISQCPVCQVTPTGVYSIISTSLPVDSHA
jgi:hypothetical protein